MEEHTAGVSELLDRIKRYCDSTVINDVKLADETKISVNLTPDEIKNLSSEECHTHAFLLRAYCHYLASKADILKAQLVFLNSELDQGYAKYWSNYDPKLPWEQKRMSIVRDNSYLSDIYKHKTELTARLQVFENRFEAIRGQAEALDKVGDRKRFG